MSWTCPSCGSASESAGAGFCARCGEQRLDRSAPAGFVSWRRWRHSLLELMRHPGSLTADWRAGRRRGQVAPLSLFLAINVVFFITQSLSGLLVVSIPLQSHLKDQPYAAVANEMLEARLAKRGLDRDRFADRFDLQQQTIAKASIIALTLPMAMMCSVMFWRRKERMATHWAFALHFHAYALVFMIGFFAGLGLLLRYCTARHWTIDADTFDNAVTFIQLVFLGGYLYLAAARVYAVKGALGAAATAALVAMLAAALYAHRFGVFVVTLFAV